MGDVPCTIECTVDIPDGPDVVKLQATKPKPLDGFVVDEVCCSTAID